VPIIPATQGSTNRWIVVQAGLGINEDPTSKIIKAGQAPVAHACNPSYSGGRGLENQGSKSAQANSLQNPSQKRTGGVAQGVGPEFKPQYCKIITK
jgi:hypothetical protein